MAISRTNILLHGFKGKLADYVVRRWGESTVLSKKPNTKHRRWSKLQKSNRQRFREAMAYARRVLSNPEMRAYYARKKRKMQTTWNVAVADYLLNPSIDLIDIREYNGKPGEQIYITTHDKYRVESVVVSILDSQGIEIESGPAVRDFGFNFTYTTFALNPCLKGCKVVVTAFDVPGNEVSDFTMIEQV